MEMPRKYPRSYDRRHDLPRWERHAMSYLKAMSFKHPIMYILFYRWWIPMLLSPQEREYLNGKYQEYYEDHLYFERPYWVEFSSHHPVQFFLLYLVWLTCLGFVKLLTAPVKIVRRMFKGDVFQGVETTDVSDPCRDGSPRVNGVSGTVTDDELPHEDDNMPSQ